MTPTAMLLTAPAAAVALTLGLALPVPSDAATTRDCRSVTVKKASGSALKAHGIRATGVSCRTTRVAVRACLRDRLRGWRVGTAPSPDDRDPDGLVILDRGRRHISFQIKGRGGCA